MSYTSLGEVCHIEKGSIGIMKAVPGEYPLVTTAEQRASHNEYQFDGEAVIIPLVSSTGHGHASIKRVHFEAGKFTVGSILAACTPKNPNEYSAKFLYIYFSVMKDVILVPLMKGSANVSLTITNLKTAKVPKLSIDEQFKVVTLYEKLKEKYDVLSKELEKSRNEIEKLRIAILNEAVQGKLTASWRNENPKVEPASTLLNKAKEEKERLIREKIIRRTEPLGPFGVAEIPFEIPEKWEWSMLGNYVLCERGRFSARPRNDPQYYNGEYPFIQIGDLPDTGGTIKGHRQTLNKKGLTVSKLFPINTIAIAIVGATIGNTGILKYDTCFPDSLIGIRPSTNFDTEYLEFFLRLRKQKFREESYSGGGQPNIKLSTLENTLFPIPPLREQREIVKRLQTFINNIERFEQQLKDSTSISEQLVQAVLAELLGEEKMIPEEQERRATVVESNLKRQVFYDHTTTLMKLEELLKEHGKLHAEDLWKMSEFPDDIDGFYAELKKQIEEEKTIQEVPSEKGYLELV